jgi:GTP-binding protein
VDTGGVGIVDADHLSEHVEDQIEFAIQSAALILFLVDARDGVTPLDRRVAERLRKQDRPVLLVANKVDEVGTPTEIHQMHALGFGEPLAVSATHHVGKRELLARISEIVGKAADAAPPKPIMKLAIVGKRNAGKSTFINALAGEERVIVSETPGTTRDSVDVTVDIAGRTLMLIDTAGVRKRKSFSGDIEYYSHHRAMRSIRRADVVALMIDASTPISMVDKELAGEIMEQFKPVVLVVNKWDLAREKSDGEAYRDYLDKCLPEFAFAPVCLTTASAGENVEATVEIAEQLFEQARTRIPTSELNSAIQDAVGIRAPSTKKGTKFPKILYASQISTEPPTIVCFVNSVESFDHRYQRYMLNRLRERLSIKEVPIRLIFRPRHKPMEE